MARKYIITIIQLLFLVFVQVVFLNHLRLFTYFLPIVYLYPVFKLPIRTERWVTTLLGAFSGILLDAFMNTPGLNMAISTLVAYFRNPILNFILGDDIDDREEDSPAPSFMSMKSYKYLLYLSSLTFIHVTGLLLTETFSLSLFDRTIPYVLGSTLISIPLMLIFDAFGRRVKR